MLSTENPSPQTLPSLKQAKRSTFGALVALIGLVGLLASVLALTGPTSNSALAQAQEQTSFAPAVGIAVPLTDADGNGANDFAGTHFVVTFASVAGSDERCTKSENTTFTVQNNGGLAGSRIVLVDRPVGETMNCVYDVFWPVVAGLVRQPGATATVQSSARTASAFYEPEASSTLSPVVLSTFSPVVLIEIPQRDTDGNGINDFAGVRFAVTVTQTSGFDAGCTGIASWAYVVQNSGAVALVDAVPVLVDRTVGGASGCVYGVRWPDIAGFERWPGATVTVQASAKTASARYGVAPATYFSPVMSITIPQTDFDGNGIDDYSGTVLLVEFQKELGSDVACSPFTSRRYVVQDSGVVTLSGSDLVFVDRPAGSPSSCVYDILWRPRPYLIGFELQPGATAKIKASANIATANFKHWVPREDTYAGPYISLVLPQLDKDGDGVYDLKNAFFDVKFVPVEGSNAGCLGGTGGRIIGEPNYVKYRSRVVNDRKLSRVGISGHYRLINRLAGVIPSCAYDILWPSAIAVNGNDIIRPFFEDGKPQPRFRAYNASRAVFQSGTTVFQPDISEQFSIPARTISAVYVEAVDDLFSPVVDISVPLVDANGDGVNDFSGTSFVVGFRRMYDLDTVCTDSANGTYVVQDDGSVSGSAPVLMDRPLHVPPSCEYVVVWPDVAGLEKQSGATEAVSASAKSATAVYRPLGGPATFSPVVDVSVPLEDADGNGVNDFSGTSFVVGFRRVFGSDARCSNSASGTYMVQDDGSVSGTDPVLMDRPAGVTAGCVYVVVWPDVEGLEKQPGATGTVSASSRSASAAYLSGVTYIAPETTEPESVATEPEDEGAMELDENELDESQSPDDLVDDAGTTTESGAGSGAGTVVPVSGVVSLPKGWVMLPFNGPSGMSPADFAQAMENAINSVWVWDMAAQQWQGWTASRGSIGLTSLLPGDVVMVYVPTGGVVVYSPADLLGHRVGVNSWTLAPTGISLVVYGGGSATSASDVFASYANSAVVVYLWDSQNQRWEYHLPGRQPLSAVQVPWFSDINPGDAMFVYNISPAAVTIPWQ